MSTRLLFFARAALALALLFSSLAPLSVGQANGQQQGDAPFTKARQMLSSMTPEEKVGQLFLVTFRGRDVGENTQIFKLITDNHIGGVVFQATNDNFTGPEQTTSEIYRMTSELQSAAWSGAPITSGETPSGGRPTSPNYIPLLIGISQEGDGYPNDQILSGLTQLPDLMAIGASWKPELANRVGQVVGQELQALGFNLYLGPDLDVVDQSYTGITSDLGAAVFGGSSYWVGEMGKAYIAGMHVGSNGQMAVIAKNFPGRGSSDRSPLDEVGTVQKSLDRLKQVDLTPFFAVTGNAVTPESTADGLLVDHIRYQGLQGNIRPITKPVSLDATAMNQLLTLPSIGPWRDQGGIVMSNDLGSRAIRRFYDASLRTFDMRQVARDAFLAGNDLLYADNFLSSGEPDSYTTIVHTLQFFAQKYREDQAFQQRVDASVTRILALKLRLYSSFEIPRVIPPQSGLDGLDSLANRQVANDVASQSVTLINPSPTDLDTVIPQPPDRNDKIVFITDSMAARQCALCSDENMLAVDALQNAVLKFYGPQVSGQASTARLTSYSFSDLDNLLNGVTGLQALADDLHSANWLVFSTLDSNKDRPGSDALKRLLTERPDYLQKDQRVLVFAFNSPSYLDATDISKVSAYYGFYSKTSAFIDVAARILYRELQPLGQLPVSVTGAGYDLDLAISPDPDQIIPLIIDTQATGSPTETSPTNPAETPVVAPPPTFKVGDLIPIRTGIIRDHNHHAIPDGTPVRFSFIRNGDTANAQQIQTSSLQGSAKASFKIESDGLLEIRVAADPARTSGILLLNISKGESAGVTAIVPTPQPTETPSPTLTPTLTPTPEATPAPAASVHLGFGDWLLAMLLIAACAVGVYFAGVWWGSMRWGVRWALCAALGGALVYAYLATGMPGVTGWMQSAGRGATLGLTLLGAMLGWGGGLIWRFLLEQKSLRKLQR